MEHTLREREWSDGRVRQMATMRALRAGAVVVVLAAAAPGLASDQASASVGCTIASAIAIAKDTGMDLEFGIVKPDIVAPSTVTISPTSTLRTKTGDCTLLSGTTPALAEFTVSGAPGAAYSIVLPPDGAVMIVSGESVMHVNGFISDPADTGKLASHGEQKLKVGATLEVGASQPAGRYTGTFDVIVSYN